MASGRCHVLECLRQCDAKGEVLKGTELLLLRALHLSEPAVLLVCALHAFLGIIHSAPSSPRAALIQPGALCASSS